MREGSMQNLLKFSLLWVVCPIISLFGYTTVSGNVSGMTWTAGTYYVSGNIDVSNGSILTIDPGAVVKFGPGVNAYVYGTIDAIGTSGSEIYFTAYNDDSVGEKIAGSSGNPQPGTWSSIFISGDGTNLGLGQFDRCVIRYGGSSSSYPGNVHFYYTDSGYIKNSTVSNSLRHGVYSYYSTFEVSSNIISNNTWAGIQAENNSPVVTNNQFLNNTGYAANLMNVNTTPYSGNYGSGNGYNGMAVAGRAAFDQTWSHGDNFPFILNGALDINDEVTLTLSENTVLKGMSNGIIYCYGTLNSIATSGNEIVFTSIKDDSYGGDTNNDGTASTPAAGNWYNIILNGDGTNNGVGRFDHNIIRYGGGNSSYPCNVYFNYTETGYIKNSTVSYSLKHGIYSYYSTLEVSSNIISNNTLAGIQLENNSPLVTNNQFLNNAGYAANLMNVNTTPYSGNSGSGNGYNGLAITGRAASDQAWSHGTDFPFILSGTLDINDEVTLTLSENTIIKGMTSGIIYCYGTLISKATEGNEIVFTSIKDDSYGGDTNNDGTASAPAAGNWYNIVLNGDGTNNGVGKFDHNIIRYGGGSTSYSGEIHINYSDSAYVKNSTISHSSRHGIYSYYSSPVISSNIISTNTWAGLQSENNSPVVTNNQFMNNTGYAAKMLTVQTTAYADNSGSGNGYNGMSLTGNVPYDQTWSHGYNFPFILSGIVNINDNAILNLSENTVLKSESSGIICCYGTLNSIASAVHEIVFTSIRDDSFGGDTNNDGSSSSPAEGDWYGLYFTGEMGYEGIAKFDHNIIRYGGGSSSYPGNIILNYCDSAYIRHSEISYSARNGIFSYYCSPEISSNIISYNKLCGAYSDSNSPIYSANEFYNNTSYGANLYNVITTAYSGNTGSGNGYNGLKINGTVTTDQIWSHGTDFPFILSGTITVNDDISLTLSPGTVLKGESNSYMNIVGNLNSIGTAVSRIVFTSIKDDSSGGDTNNDGLSSAPAGGDWDGIRIDGYSSYNGTGYFEYTDVFYGGRTGGYTSGSNIYWYYSDSGYFRNSRTKFSANIGFNVYYCKPEASNSSFSNNGSYGIYTDNAQSTMSITGNTFETNGNHGLYLCNNSIASIDNNTFTSNSGYGAYLDNLWLYSYTGNTGSGNTNDGFGIYGGNLWNGSATWTSGSKSFPFIVVGGNNSTARVLIQQHLTIGTDTSLKFNAGAYSYMWDNSTGGYVSWSSGSRIWLVDVTTASYPYDGGVLRFSTDQRYWPQEWILSTYQPGDCFLGGTYVTILHTGNVSFQYPISVSNELILTSGNIVQEYGGTLTMQNNSKITRENGTIASQPVFGTSVNLEYIGTAGVTTGYEIPSTNIINTFSMNKSGGLTLDRNVQVNNTLNLTSGNITTGSNTITLGSSSVNLGTFTRNAGIVIGNFKRWFAASAVNNVIFPVGTSTIYRPLALSFTSAPSAVGTITASFISSDPGDNGLPLADGGSTIHDASMFGYWTAVPGNGLSGGIYSLDANATGFGGIKDYTDLHLLKRDSSSSPWTSAGTHQTATGSNSAPVLHRAGLTSFSEFGVGNDSGMFNYGPENAAIVKVAESYEVTWDEVTGALSYSVYSSTDPYASFPTGWTLEAGGIIGTAWTIVDMSASKKFYVVVAVF
jgi:hypothetical protein